MPWRAGCPGNVPVTSMACAETADKGGFRDPVFLLAPARSYTTVSIAVLAGHPELYGLPETNLFLRDTVGEIIAIPDGSIPTAPDVATR